MKSSITLARPYAKALFEQALAGECLAEWSEQIALLARISEDAQMQALFRDPRMQKSRLVALFVDLAQAPAVIAKALENFLSRLLKITAFLLADMACLFHQYKNEHDQLRGEVVSTQELTEQQKAALKKALEKQFQEKVAVSYRMMSPSSEEDYSFR